MKPIAVILPLILGLLASGPVWGDESGVTVAVVQDSADVPAGLAVMTEAYAELGIAVEFHRYSASEALALSNAGKVDAELQRIDGINKHYLNLVKVPIPINIIQGAVFSKKYRFPVSGWHSLRPYRIGIVRGILFAEQQTIGMNRTVFDSYEALLTALNAETIDVGVMPRIGGLAAIQSLQQEGIYEMEGVLETLFLYHYVHADREGLVELLTPVLKSMLLSGRTRAARDGVLAELGERR